MRLGKVFLLVLIFLLPIISWAQTPTSCFEIESILVDACGAGLQEGINEEVIFHVGPTNLNTANLTSIVWPNGANPYTGICQNAATAAKVLQINNTITCCGRLIEPVGGVLPAGRRVILFTSVNVDVTLHSFANLCDTLIAIFHCGSNAAGNFANSGTGLRTLTMTFNPPVGCTETVTYDRAGLALANGASAQFTWSGTPSYSNVGCVPAIVQPNADAGVATPTTACIGQSIQLNGTVSNGNYLFNWYGGAGTFSNPNILNPTYTPGPGETGSVTLYLHEHTGCRDAIDSVTFNISPPPTVSVGNDTAFCGNFTYTLDPGPGWASYSWNTSASTPTINATLPGIYAVTVTNAAGCPGVDSMTIGVSQVHNLGFPPDDTICPGDLLSLFPNQIGSNYAWSTGANTPSIVIGNPNTYMLTLTLATPANCIGMDTFVLSNYPGVAVNLGNDTTICPGNTVTLDAGVIPAGSYDWSNGQTSQTITTDTAGVFVVTVTNSSGCTAMDTMEVIVNATIPLNLGADTAFCVGGAVLLDAGGTGPYSWSTGDNTQTLNVDTSGTYSVTVTFGVNCASSDTITVQVNPNPVVDLGPDTLYCPGSTMILDAGNPGATYAWNPSASSQTVSVTNGGTYFVTVTNAFQCADSDSVVVTLGQIADVSLPASLQLCFAGSATLDAGPNATSYLWSTNAVTQTISVNAAGVYWVVGTTNCGTDSVAINVTMLPQPSVDAGPDDTICAGETYALAGATATSGIVLWSAPNGSFDHSDSLHANFTSDSLSAGNQTLLLTLTDSCGTYTDSMHIFVRPQLDVTFTLPDTACYGQAVQFSYTGNATEVMWMGAGTFSDSIGNPTFYTPAPGEQGDITIQALATGDCPSHLYTLTYQSDSLLEADFVWSPGAVWAGTYVQFQNTTVPSGLPDHWSFGDGFFSIAYDPEHRFYNAGDFDVELIVYGHGGCNDTVVHTLNVIPTDTLFPNVFSPNGDGINDVFNVTVPKSESYHLLVFDRWGKQLFASHNPDDKWDGKSNGADVPDGVYFYIIQIKTLAAGPLINYQGNVSVLR
jgi:gliding motility-associated-like protein